MVIGLTLIPHFAFSVSLLERRKPLSSRAERHDWVGCNFLLDRIPLDARIPVIHEGHVVSPSKVREAYKRVKPLEKLSIEKRGWTLDVLNAVRALKKTEFSLADVYAHTDELAKLHPNNAHVRDKIRQQLQVLRDLGLLQFLGGGDYRLS